MEIREALAKAHETVSSSTPAPAPVETTSTPAPETAAAPETTPAAVTPSPAASARARDEHGRFAPKPGDEPAEKVAAAPKAGANGAAASAPPATEAKPGAVAPPPTAPGEAVTPKPDPAARPPQSWRADEREEFAKAPPKVQAAVLRREREIQTKLNEVAQTARAAEEFHRVSAPWEPMFRSQGVSATQAFDNLARTYYALQTAPLPQRAQIIASVIQQAGIPVELLAQALDGQPAGAQAQPHVDPRAIAQQATAQIRAELQAEAAKIARAKAEARIADWESKFDLLNTQDDAGTYVIRNRIANVLEAQGIVNPSDEQFAEAYDDVVSRHPLTKGVVAQRRAAKAAPSAQASTAAIQAAASSVRSTPAAPPQRAAQPGSSIRSAMQAAREQLERQGR